MTRTLTVALFALTACAPEASPPSPGEAPLDAAWRALRTPDLVGGCGDVFIHASTAADDKAFFISLTGALAQAAHDAGADMTHTFMLPDPDADVTLQWGTNITHAACNDALWLPITVDGEAVAVGGTLVVELAPDLSSAYGIDIPTDATVRLEDVVFEDAAGRTRTFTVDLGTIHVGWLPG